MTRISAVKKPKRKMSLAKIYSRAADLLQKNGWCRHKLQNDQGHMCILGAISQVVDGDAYAASNDTHNMLTPLAQFTGGKHPVEWNNHFAKDKRQVVGLLRKAAREVRT